MMDDPANQIAKSNPEFGELHTITKCVGKTSTTKVENKIRQSVSSVRRSPAPP